MKNSAPLLLILLAVVLCFFLGRPAYSEVLVLKEEGRSYEQTIRDIDQIIETKNQLLAKLNSIPQSERERINKFLPTKSEAIKMIASIDGIALRHGITLEEGNNNGNSNSQRSISEAASTGYYDTATLDIKFSANYGNMTSFLKDVERSLRVVDIVSVSVSSPGGSVTPNSVYNYTVTLQIYYLKMAQ